jgi:hypothetical protein
MVSLTKNRRKHFLRDGPEAALVMQHVAEEVWPAAVDHVGQDQREGMGLLEYQTMPYLCEGAHDGWLLHFLYNSSWKFHQLIAGHCGQLLSGQPVRYGTKKAGGTARPSRTNHTCRVSLLQPARRAAVLAQLLVSLVEMANHGKVKYLGSSSRKEVQ